VATTTTSTPAWTPPDLAANPHERTDKPQRVRAMFGAIARSYDLNNRLHSFGRDQSWRRFAVKQASVKPTDEVLDCACGTGDLTRLFAKSGARRVVGLDFTAEMLEIAEAKRRAGHAGDSITSYIEGDAMALPFADGSFDIVSIAFGIRNVADPHKVLAEFRRVLRPGGRLVILEFDRPTLPVIGALSDFYTRRIMPLTATLISGDRSGAYRYLPKSVATFLTRQQLSEAIANSGFAGVSATPLTFGVCICHRGVVPPAA
jgi:demethylmenaquinone methyltransferase / 2-methoxy-6-polyprenyl-1,4-benzoquinol methylase